MSNTNETYEVMELENYEESNLPAEADGMDSEPGLSTLAKGLIVAGVAAGAATVVAIGKKLKGKKDGESKKANKPAKKFRPKLTLFEEVAEVEEDIIDSEAVDVEETEE